MIFKTKISHHRPEDKVWMKEIWELELAKLPEILEKLPQSPFMLSSIAGFVSDFAGYELLFRNDKLSFWSYWKLAHLSRTWHWKALIDEEVHEIRLPDREPFSVGKVTPNIDVSLSTYLEGVYLAMVLRDQSAMDVYRTVPFEPLQSRMGSSHKPFLHHWMNFLKIVGTNSPDIQAELTKTYELSAPEGDITAGRVDWLTNVFRPFVLLWQPILDNDPDEFNRALRDQQKKWKAYHSVEPHLRNRISGFYCMPALAAVCYVHDHGFPITVKSDYLPKFLVKGEFPRLEWPNPDWIEKP